MRSVLLLVCSWSLDLVGVVWVVAAAYFAIVRRGTARQKAAHFLRTFLPEPWLLVLIPVLLLVVAVVPGQLWHDLTYRSTVLAVPGAAIVVASAALMCWARWTIGAMWAGRPLLQEGHDLCTDGPYRIVRHPIYTGIVGAAVGYTLVAGFGAALAVLLATLGFVAWRVWAEERLMVVAFGDRYRRYRATVPALVPFARPAG